MSAQGDLFRDRPVAVPRRTPDFDGVTYVRVRDQLPLMAQLQVVTAVMADGKWRTLAELALAVGAPEASVSARLRDLRKPKFGGLTVLRQIRPGSQRTWEYRVARPGETPPEAA